MGLLVVDGVDAVEAVAGFRFPTNLVLRPSSGERPAVSLGFDGSPRDLSLGLEGKPRDCEAPMVRFVSGLGGGGGRSGTVGRGRSLV
jgi:hypothetical protein